MSDIKGKIYYAVRVGRKVGVYTDWKECKKQVIGFKGADYKKFFSNEDAEKYVKNVLENNSDDINKYDIFAFVDGSYDNKTKIFGAGGFIINRKNPDDILTPLLFYGKDEKISKMRNVAGELVGTINAINTAINKKYEELTIFYDYNGIEKWVNGDWSANKEYTKQYKEFVNSVKDKINIKFIKVKGHSGVNGNEIADKLAKLAVKIGIHNDKNKEFSYINELMDLLTETLLTYSEKNIDKDKIKEKINDFNELKIFKYL